MKIVNDDRDHALEGMKAGVNGQSAQVEWRYFGDSTHFILLVSSARTNMTIEQFFEQYTEIGINDEDFMNRGTIDFGKARNTLEKAVIINAQQYSRDQRGWKSNLRNLTGGKHIPIRVAVYACRVRRDNNIEVFNVDDESNVVYIPITVHFTKVTKGVFGKKIILQVDPVDQFENGSIGYTFVDQELVIPLTQGALGKPLEINVPGSEEPELYVKKEFRKLYTLVERARK